MIITNTINTDLWIRERTQEINAVQGDSCTRRITVKLFANREPWVPDADVSVVIRYHRPDGSGGSYDTLPDGETAWELTDNAVSFILAPQMLAVPGRVAVQVEMLWENGVLASFPLHVLVEENVAAGMTSSGSYFSWEQRLGKELLKTLEQAKQSGEFAGATPQLQIGTVSTLNAGEAATATIRGTPEHPVLDLALPKGEDATVDATLAVSGSAADAAAVGAALEGKAPAGYGLGELAKSTMTWKSLALSGFRRSSTESPDGTLWWGICNSNTENSGTHIAFTTKNGCLVEAMRYFTKSGQQASGTWEYVNPPMEAGVEYRTTERWGGGPVYTMAVANIGKLPNASSKKVEATEANCTLLRVAGFIEHDITFDTMPLDGASFVDITLKKDTGEVEITTTIDGRSWFCYPVIYYVKP